VENVKVPVYDITQKADPDIEKGGSAWPANDSRPPGTVHIVTVLYNSAAVLDRFMTSLAAQTHTDWRLIAVDNNSHDGSPDRLVALTDRRIHIIRNHANLGFARATNRGLRRALDEGGDFAIMMNNDTEFAPDFLAGFLAARDALQADAIAPRIMHLRTPAKAWYAGGHVADEWIFKSVHEEIEPANPPASRIVDFASGCCLGVTRTALQRIGLLDERFFVYWEDTDYCLRLKTAGIPIQYVRDCVMLHDSSALAGGHNSPTFIALFYRGYVQMLMKRYGLRYSIRAMLRLLAKNIAHRDSRGSRAWPRMLAAMLRGLAVSWPRPKQVRLNPTQGPVVH
jgi:GT2 family glycosyltransferase